jgi:hypothetical protein
LIAPALRVPLSSWPITTVRSKVEQIQLVSGVEQVDLGGIGLQGA